MAVKVGINGFGRIGRLVFRALVEQGLLGKSLDVVAVNDLVPPDNLAYLLKYDSTQGKFDGTVEAKEDGFVVNGKFVKCLQVKNPAELPWTQLGAQYVIESTGLFTDYAGMEGHLKAGAKRVILSAPTKDPEKVPTLLVGVNHTKFDPANHRIVSNASCTTNCLAPIAKVINDNFKIISGTMTTIHSYTNDQVILDFPHKDLRRARAAAINMIPTSTGAAKALKLVIPELGG